MELFFVFVFKKLCFWGQCQVHWEWAVSALRANKFLCFFVWAISASIRLQKLCFAPTAPAIGNF